MSKVAWRGGWPSSIHSSNGPIWGSTTAQTNVNTCYLPLLEQHRYTHDIASDCWLASSKLWPVFRPLP